MVTEVDGHNIAENRSVQKQEKNMNGYICWSVPYTCNQTRVPVNVCAFV